MTRTIFLVLEVVVATVSDTPAALVASALSSGQSPVATSRSGEWGLLLVPVLLSLAMIIVATFVGG